MTASGSAWMPLHAAQEVVYFDQLRDPRGAKYNVGGYIRIRGAFDAKLFGGALERFSRTHPQERIEIESVAGVPRQRPAPVESLPALATLEFPAFDEALAWMQARMDCAFDLARPPLHEHALLRIDARDVLYFARYHHVVADAYSFALKIRSVVDLYLRLAAGETVEAPGADAGFRGEIDACRSYLDSAEHADDAGYWSRKYAQLPAPVWPAANGSADGRPSCEAAVELPAASTQRLLHLAAESGASPAHVLLAVVGVHVARSTGARDFVVGVPVHNRVYRRQKSLFGMFTTIMPSRVALDGAATFRQLVQQIASSQNEDMAHRRHPWTQLARELRARDERRASLFDVAVNFERFVPWPETADLRITAHELASRQEDIPLHVKLCDFDSRQPQLLKVACSAGMLRGRAVDDVAAQLLASLAEALADPDRALHSLCSATDAGSDYWNRSLADAPPPPELPLDRPRAPQSTAAMDDVDVPLPAGLEAGIATLAKHCEATPLAVLFAAWTLLQSRLAGEPDVVSGLATDDSVLPLRVRIDSAADVATLIRSAAQTVSDGLAHRAAWRPAGQPPLRAVLSWQAVASPAEEAGIDLRMAVSGSQADFALRLGYAGDRIDARTAQRWAGHFTVLLQALCADASALVGDLPILDAAQRHDLLERFNATRVEYPERALIHELFEAQVARSPGAVALEYEATTLTYAQLNARANRLAHALRAQGVAPDRLVAVCAGRGVDLVVAMLAVLKAGGAYVPLDPAYPADRLRSMLDDASPVLVLSERSCRERVPHTSAPVWLLDDDAIWNGEPAANLPPGDQHSRQLAYVIYTSGSTGRPKGVMVEHRSVVRLVVNNDFAPIGPEDCIAQCASPAFDATTWEVWASLLHGARLLLVPLPVLLTPDELNRRFLERGVTALFITVALFNEYVEPMAEAFGRLKYLLVGGDVLDPRKVAAVVNSPRAPRWFKACYGPTETTTFASMHPVTHVGADVRSIALGTPIANTSIYVLDAHGQPAPIGVCGELYIGGPGVARGYLNRPELTAEKFVADPFGRESGARLYRTGDLGCVGLDGTIEFRGRNDFQVKIRGFRVEPSEVEIQLFEKAPVATCAVLALEGPGRNKYLAAWVVPAAGRASECEPAALRALLSASMPDYLVPSVFVVVDALPMTTNGKIDRAALRASGARPSAGASGYVAPVDATQRVIAATWAELLGIARIGLYDDIWTLGWHSLLATQALTRLRDAFQVELPFRALLETSTVAQAADAVAACCGGREVANRIAEVVESVIALSEEQASLLLHQAAAAAGQAETAAATADM
jgi:amino acid adenylation domain-containing protein